MKDFISPAAAMERRKLRNNIANGDLSDLPEWLRNDPFTRRELGITLKREPRDWLILAREAWMEAFKLRFKTVDRGGRFFTVVWLGIGTWVFGIACGPSEGLDVNLGPIRLRTGRRNSWR